jgi:hypothetical protein
MGQKGTEPFLSGPQGHEPIFAGSGSVRDFARSEVRGQEVRGQCSTLHRSGIKFSTDPKPAEFQISILSPEFQLSILSPELSPEFCYAGWTPGSPSGAPAPFRGRGP